MKSVLKTLATALSAVLIYESVAIPMAQAAALTPPPALRPSVGQFIQLPALSPIAKTIYHIQDIHTETAAQINLYGIVTELSKHAASQGKKLLVFVEGSTGLLDSDLISNMPNREAVRDVGAGLLRKGLLFGEEYAAILSKPGEIRLVGVENPELYKENGEARDSTREARETVLRDVREINRQLTVLNQHNFNPAVARLEAARKQAGTNGSFVDYVKILSEIAPQVVASHPEINVLVNLVKKEQTLDFQKIEAAHQKIIAGLAAQTTEAGMKEMVNRALAVKEGRLSALDYYSDLQKKAPHPVLASYVAYLRAAEAVDADKTFAALDVVETDAAKALIKHPVARQLYAYHRWLERQEKFFALEMIPQEWNLQKNTQLRDVVNQLNEIREFIAEQKTALGYGFDTPVIAVKTLSRAHEGAFAFYRAATSRDQVMAQNVESYLRNNKEERVVAFIAGGFHTPGLTTSLKKSGYNVAVIRPQLETKIDLSQKVNFYRAPGALTNAPALEQTIETGKLTQKPEPFAGENPVRKMILEKVIRDNKNKLGILIAIGSLPFLIAAASPGVFCVALGALISTEGVRARLLKLIKQAATQAPAIVEHLRRSLSELESAEKIVEEKYSVAERRLSLKAGTISKILMSPDGSVMAAVTKSSVIVRNLKGKGQKSYQSKAGDITGVIFSPDGKQVLFGTDSGLLAEWDIKTGKEQTVLKHTSPVEPVAYDSKQKQMLYLHEGDVVVWSLGQAKIIRRERAELAPIAEAAAGPREGQIVARTVLENLFVLNKSGYYRLDYLVEKMVMSPDRKILALRGRNGIAEVMLYSNGAFQKAFKLDVSGFVSALQFSPDGKTLAISLHNGYIELWDTEKWTKIRSLYGEYEARALEFTPDGHGLLSLTGHNIVTAWEFAQKKRGPGASKLASIALLLTLPYFMGAASPDAEKSFDLLRWGVTAAAVMVAYFVGKRHGNRDEAKENRKNSVRIIPPDPRYSNWSILLAVTLSLPFLMGADPVTMTLSLVAFGMALFSAEDPRPTTSEITNFFREPGTVVHSFDISFDRKTIVVQVSKQGQPQVIFLRWEGNTRTLTPLATHTDLPFRTKMTFASNSSLTGQVDRDGKKEQLFINIDPETGAVSEVSATEPSNATRRGNIYVISNAAVTFALEQALRVLTKIVRVSGDYVTPKMKARFDAVLVELRSIEKELEQRTGVSQAHKTVSSLVDAQGLEFRTHSGQVWHNAGHRGQTLAYDPIGNYLVSADEQGTILIWEADGWELKKEFRGKGKPVIAAEFKENKRLVVNYGDGQFTEYDLSGLKPEAKAQTAPSASKLASLLIGFSLLFTMGAAPKDGQVSPLVWFALGGIVFSVIVWIFGMLTASNNYDRGFEDGRKEGYEAGKADESARWDKFRKTLPLVAVTASLPFLLGAESAAFALMGVMGAAIFIPGISDKEEKGRRWLVVSPDRQLAISRVSQENGPDRILFYTRAPNSPYLSQGVELPADFIAPLSVDDIPADAKPIFGPDGAISFATNIGNQPQTLSLYFDAKNKSFSDLKLRSRNVSGVRWTPLLIIGAFLPFFMGAASPDKTGSVISWVIVAVIVYLIGIATGYFLGKASKKQKQKNDSADQILLEFVGEAEVIDEGESAVQILPEFVGEAKTEEEVAPVEHKEIFRKIGKSNLAIANLVRTGQLPQSRLAYAEDYAAIRGRRLLITQGDEVIENDQFLQIPLVKIKMRHTANILTSNRYAQGSGALDAFDLPITAEMEERFESLGRILSTNVGINKEVQAEQMARRDKNYLRQLNVQIQDHKIVDEFIKEARGLEKIYPPIMVSELEADKNLLPHFLQAWFTQSHDESLDTPSREAATLRLQTAIEFLTSIPSELDPDNKDLPDENKVQVGATLHPVHDLFGRPMPNDEERIKGIHADPVDPQKSFKGIDGVPSAVVIDAVKKAEQDYKRALVDGVIHYGVRMAGSGRRMGFGELPLALVTPRDIINALDNEELEKPEFLDLPVFARYIIQRMALVIDVAREIGQDIEEQALANQRFVLEVSETNADEIIEYLTKNKFFGLSPHQFRFLEAETIPGFGMSDGRFVPVTDLGWSKAKLNALESGPQGNGAMEDRSRLPHNVFTVDYQGYRYYRNASLYDLVSAEGGIISKVQISLNNAANPDYVNDPDHEIIGLAMQRLGLPYVAQFVLDDTGTKGGNPFFFRLLPQFMQKWLETKRSRGVFLLEANMMKNAAGRKIQQSAKDFGEGMNLDIGIAHAAVWITNPKTVSRDPKRLLATVRTKQGEAKINATLHWDLINWDIFNEADGIFYVPRKAFKRFEHKEKKHLPGIQQVFVNQDRSPSNRIFQGIAKALKDGLDPFKAMPFDVTTFVGIAIALPLIATVAIVVAGTRWLTSFLRPLFAVPSNGLLYATETTYAGHTMTELAAIPETNRKTWAEQVRDVVRAHLTNVPQVQKVLINVDDFQNTLGDQNKLLYISAAWQQRLAQFYGVTDMSNQVELLLVGHDKSTLEAAKAIAVRGLGVRTTTLSPEQAQKLIQGDLKDQKIYVLTPEARENTDTIIYQQVSDKMLDVTLAVFSYTKYGNPVTVFKDFADSFLSLSDAIKLQIFASLFA